MADNKPENSAAKQELALFTNGLFSKVTSVQIASICIQSLDVGVCTYNPSTGCGGRKIGRFLKLLASHSVSSGFSQRLQNDKVEIKEDMYYQRLPSMCIFIGLHIQ